VFRPGDAADVDVGVDGPGPVDGYRPYVWGPAPWRVPGVSPFSIVERVNLFEDVTVEREGNWLPMRPRAGRLALALRSLAGARR
jgi:hypothetical protein